MADVAIDTSVNTVYPEIGGRRGLVWTTEDIGYAFYIEGTNVAYSKTTDGGQNWGAAVTVISGTCRNPEVWYDKWTPGDSGTKIHVCCAELGADDFVYRNLDTSSDTLGTQRVVAAGSNFSTTNELSIAKSRGGKLLVVWSDGVDEFGAHRSTDEFATSSAAASPWEGAADQVLLFPGNEADANDMWLVFWDVSADEISLKVYDDSGDSWSETSIATSMLDASTVSGNTQMAGSIRHSDGHLLLAAWSDHDDPTADLKCWDINGAASITAKTNVNTDAAECICVALFIDQNTDDLYVFYLGTDAGTGTVLATLTVNYKKSTDGGATWGSEVAYSEDAGDDLRTIFSDLGGTASRAGAIFVNDDLNDLFFGFTNSIEIAAPADITVTPDAAALATSTFTPTVAASDNKSVSPDQLALTTAQFAPTVNVSDNQAVSPGVLSNSITLLSPLVVIGIRVTPDQGSLALSQQTPSVVNPKSASPDIVELALETFDPSVTVGIRVSPDVAGLVTATFVPTIQTPVSVSPDNVELEATLLTPEIVVGVRLEPDIGELVIATFVPQSLVNHILRPDELELVLDAKTPEATASDAQSVSPNIGELETATFAPTVALSDNQLVLPGVNTQSITLLTPSVVNPKTALPETLALVVATFIPIIALIDPSVSFHADAGAIRTTRPRAGYARLSRARGDLG